MRTMTTDVARGMDRDQQNLYTKACRIRWISRFMSGGPVKIPETMESPMDQHLRVAIACYTSRLDSDFHDLSRHLTRTELAALLDTLLGHRAFKQQCLR